MKTVFQEKYEVNKESDLLYLVQSSKKKTFSLTDISRHWDEEYAERMINMIHKHDQLFQKELDLFSDEMKMSISFIDETDLSELK